MREVAFVAWAADVAAENQLQGAYASAHVRQVGPGKDLPKPGAVDDDYGLHGVKIAAVYVVPDGRESHKQGPRRSGDSRKRLSWVESRKLLAREVVGPCPLRDDMSSP